MCTINLELYSLIIILILLLDYLLKYKKKLNINSILYFIIIVSVMLLSCCNILFNYININDNNGKLIVLLFGYILLGIPPVILSLYIKTIYFNEIKKAKENMYKALTFFTIYMIIVFAYLIMQFNEINVTQTSYIFNLLNHNKILLLSLIPLLVILIKTIVYSLKNKNSNRFNYRITCAFLLPIVALILDVTTESINLTIAAYVLSVLLLYLYRDDITLNIDPLTGVYNRRKLDERPFERRKGNKIIAAYLIDIDNFKRFNDTYGHNVGDKVLKDVGKILKNSIRNTDYPIRTGGDEFLIIASLNNKKDLRIIVNNINKALANYNKMNKEMTISLSIGYDIYNNEDYFEDFINKIDNKMYYNKRQKKEKLKNKEK